MPELPTSCNYSWTTGGRHMKDYHYCGLFKGHSGNHVCGCGENG